MNSVTDRQDDRAQISLLLDFYGQLLSERAREVLTSYFEDDLSLAEIAEQHAISRQAVHDRLHQGLDRLRQYEEKLGLATRFVNQKNEISQAIQELDQGQIESVRARLLKLEQIL
ncbi:MAG: hypothetical protein GXY22_03730 [Clostridiaceae bacterium]|jgi:predicted DNA-binding protein YlxM (UPF0122 family)|nr:sigma factor-like helix-turn-helix DNA-binding protein [Eubacteriales bacterium]NLV47748.1 hypothetical protein [Clostridiaceae bacterium]